MIITFLVKFDVNFAQNCREFDSKWDFSPLSSLPHGELEHKLKWMKLI